MKALFKLLVIIIAILLILPKYVGSLVETEHQAVLDKLAQNPQVKVIDKSFTADWFTGSARTTMMILLNDDNLDDITIVVEEKLTFGPLIISEEGVLFALSHSQADVSFNDLMAMDPEIKTFIKDKVHLSSTFTFSKSVISKVVIDEIIKTQDGNKFHFKQATSEFTLTKNNRAFGEFNWAGMTFNSSMDEMHIGAVNLNFDQSLVSGDYYQGDAIVSGYFDFTIDDIKASDNVNNDFLLIDKLYIKGGSSVNEDLMNFSLTYHADKMETSAHEFTHANLNVLFESISIEAIKSLNEFVAAFESNTDAMIEPANIEKLSVIVDKLLSSDPILSVTDLSVETPQGKIESALSIKVDKTLFNINNTMSIMQALNAQANATVPEQFILKMGVQPMADLYIEQGLLRRENDALSFDLDFSKGQLTINGNVIPL